MSTTHNDGKEFLLLDAAIFHSRPKRIKRSVLFPLAKHVTMKRFILLLLASSVCLICFQLQLTHYFISSPFARYPPSLLPSVSVGIPNGTGTAAADFVLKSRDGNAI